MSHKVTLAWIKNEVEDLKDRVGDPESFHAEEDRLYGAVLAAISRGEIEPDDIRACAAEVLKAVDINCSRWYA